MKDSGFSSVQAMLMLLILSFSVLGMGIGISLTQDFFNRREDNLQELAVLRDEVAVIIGQFGEDSTPETDSNMDTVWSYIEGKKKNMNI